MLNGKTLNIVSSKKGVFTIDDEGDFTKSNHEFNIITILKYLS